MSEATEFFIASLDRMAHSVRDVRGVVERRTEELAGLSDRILAADGFSREMTEQLEGGAAGETVGELFKTGAALRAAAIAHERLAYVLWAASAGDKLEGKK